MAALEVVKMTTFNAATDENFIKTATFLFRWLWFEPTEYIPWKIEVVQLKEMLLM